MPLVLVSIGGLPMVNFFETGIKRGDETFD